MQMYHFTMYNICVGVCTCICCYIQMIACVESCFICIYCAYIYNYIYILYMFLKCVHCAKIPNKHAYKMNRIWSPPKSWSGTSPHRFEGPQSSAMPLIQDQSVDLDLPVHWFPFVGYGGLKWGTVASKYPSKHGGTIWNNGILNGFSWYPWGIMACHSHWSDFHGFSWYPWGIMACHSHWSDFHGFSWYPWGIMGCHSHFEMTIPTDPNDPSVSKRATQISSPKGSAKTGRGCP